MESENGKVHVSDGENCPPCDSDERPLKYSPTRQDRLAALRIVGTYALFGGLWVCFSDALLGVLNNDLSVMTHISLIKGNIFILLTSLLLYKLIIRHIRQTRYAITTLEHTEQALQDNRQRLASLVGTLEERVREAVDELRQKDQLLIQQNRMAAMGEMLGNIAHHWRQPLNVLGLKLQDLVLSYEHGVFSRELLEANIEQSMAIIQHLSQVIDDFRRFSMPDRAKQLFRVDQVITKTLLLVEESFSEQHITVEFEARGEPQIVGYPNEFSQALVNILMNARDALQEQSAGNGLITVRSCCDNSSVVVTIADNAGGIDEEVMDKIFDAFFTTKPLGKGSGIGLFMAKSIIEQNMGGSLTVRNTEMGAEFRIEV